MAEAVRGHRELDRDVGTAQRVDRPVVLEVDDRKSGQDLLVHRVGHGLAHDCGHEVVGDHPLVVPPGQAPGRLEHRQPREQRGHEVLPHVIHQLVVEHLQGHVQLKQDQRLVVAGVRHDGLAVGVARHVVDHVRGRWDTPDLAVGTLDDQELVPVVGVVELRILAGASPVDGVQVVAGRTVVGRALGRPAAR